MIFGTKLGKIIKVRGCMLKLSPGKTREIWQPHYGKPLTEDDVLYMKISGSPSGIGKLTGQLKVS